MATLEHFQYMHIFGRSVAHVQVIDDGKQLFRGTLQSALNFCEDQEIELDNAQDILYRLVSKDGYAS